MENITPTEYLGRLSLFGIAELGSSFIKKAEAIVAMYLTGLWKKETMATALFACSIRYGEANSLRWDRLGLEVNDTKENQDD